MKRRKFSQKMVAGAVIVWFILSVILTGNMGYTKAIAASSKMIVGYYPEWAIYSAHNNYYVEHIPWGKVTHINYAFAKIQNGEIAVVDSWAALEKPFGDDTWDKPIKGNIGQLIKFKQLYPNVKVLISVGGWTLSGEFSDVALTEESRKKFADSCVRFIRQYSFDGVDIDWEYPVSGGLPTNRYRPEDKQNFTLLLKTLRETLDAAGAEDGKHYLLSIAAPAGYEQIWNTEPNKYHQYVDYINVMSYDYHGAWENVTNHLAPLYSNPNDPSVLEKKERYNVDWTIQEYIRLGVPREKINVGVPYYSRGWREVSTTQGINGLFAPANGAPMGIWDDASSGATGTNPFYYIKEVLEADPKYQKYRDEYAKVPWLWNAQDRIMYTYDDEESIATKCDYVLANGLGGIMFWELSGDYPSKGSTLTTLIYNKFAGGSTPTPTVTPTPTPTVTPTPTPTVTPTPTPTVTPTPTPTVTPTPTPTVTPTPTPTVTPTPTPTVTPTPTPTSVAEWQPYTAYKVGDMVSYQGQLYKCLQAHTSLPGWEPPIVPALWTLVN